MQYDLLDDLDTRIVAGQLTAERQARFYRQAVDVEMDIRRTVMRGEDAPFQFKCRRPWVTALGWGVFYQFKSIELDGAPADVRPKPSAYPSRLLADSLDHAVVIGPPVGRHVLRAAVHLDVRRGNPADPQQGGLMHEEMVTVTLPFEVVEPTASNRVELVDAPGVAALLRSGAKPHDFKYSLWHRGDLFGVIDLPPLPVNVAFDLLARYGGREYPIGHGAKAAGGGVGLIRCDSAPGAALPEPPATIDVVLRASRKAAGDTIDLYRIWGGEVVLSGVPVAKGNAHSDGCGRARPSARLQRATAPAAKISGYNRSKYQSFAK